MIVGLLSPFPVLILTVVYAAYSGGLLPALVSVARDACSTRSTISPCPACRCTTRGENGASLLVVASRPCSPACWWPALHERVRQAQYARASPGADAEALARRFTFLEQASLILELRPAASMPPFATSPG